MQLGNLLYTNCRDLANELKKDQIIGKLIDVFEKCMDGFSIVVPLPGPPYLVIESAWSYESYWMDMLWKQKPKDHFQISFWFIYKIFLDAYASYSFSYYDPTIAEFREHANVSYFGCVFLPSYEAAEVFQIIQRPNMRLQKIPEALNFPDVKERLLHCIFDHNLKFILQQWSGFCSLWNLR